MNTLLAVLVVVFWLVSTYCQVSLFVGFADTPRDQWHAGLFASLLVAAQYLFIEQMARTWAMGKLVLASATALLALVLVAVSVAGSTLYFESRYQVKTTAAQQGGHGYAALHALIENKQKSADAFKALANEELARGNKLLAGRHMNAASSIEQDLPNLIDQLARQPKQAGVASSIGLIGEWRWMLWLCFALIADFVPALAIVLIRSGVATRETAVLSNKTAVLPAVTGVETAQQQPNTDPQQGQTPCQIRLIINELGRMPSFRECTARGVKYSTYKQSVEHLLKSGVIEKDGQSFRLKQPLQAVA